MILLDFNNVNNNYHIYQKTSTVGHRSFVGSSKFLGFVPPGSSGYLRRALCRLFASLEVDRRDATLTSAGLPFQHLGTPILPLQLHDSLSYVGNSGSSTDLHISDLIT
ncbi:jg5168 [Pararge aegeria aegeria]|uniref:Jg5168 protein n=1 Tax=Pararge aegeria aegeria TaxID=348720 RepID=A0A8S4S0K6_9NEOP|nr:jg5168 [Pararge aegeria aegeria]